MKGFLVRQSSACWMAAVQALFYSSSAEESTRKVQCQNVEDKYPPISYLCILLLKKHLTVLLFFTYFLFLFPHPSTSTSTLPMNYKNRRFSYSKVHQKAATVQQCLGLLPVQKKSDSLWMAAEGEMQSLSYRNAVSSLLAAHWFTYYVALLVLSSENTQKHSARVNSTISKGILQTNNWPVISVDFMELPIPPDVVISSRRAAAVSVFGAGTQCPLWEPRVLLCPWKKSFHFCQIAMMRK